VSVARHRRAVALAAMLAASLLACSNPERDRLKATTKASYDRKTGRLTELTFDANRNGRIDTWTEMDGTRPVRSRIDTNEDGRIDRWEYYDAQGRLSKVGFSRKNGDVPDAWAFSTPGGRIERIEASSMEDERRIDRWEFYDVTAQSGGTEGTGPLLRVEEDTNHDGRPDKWERYQAPSTGSGQAAVLVTAEFDETFDGRPDRRLTYRDAALVAIETAPDAAGNYTHRIEPK
jgi:hypothetical protein